MSATTTVEIRSLINQRGMSSRQWILTVLCALIVFADGIDVAIMGFVAPPIIAAWGISRAAFGAVMGAAPIGLAIGAVLAGSSSDWFGRRKVLLGSVLAFGMLTLLTSIANNVTELVLLRLLTGLGLGAAMPNATTLLSEYVPDKHKSAILAAMFTGFNLGSAAIGFAAAALIPAFGWKSVFYFGAIIPLALFPILLIVLPESARFLVVREAPVQKIAALLSRITGANVRGAQRFTIDEEHPATHQPVAVLFNKEFALRTFTLWMTYFMGLLVIYLTTSWLPTMMKDAGMPIDRAANVTAMFQLFGTLGALLVGLLMDRFGANRTIAVSYFLGGLMLVVLGLGGIQSGLLAVAVGAVGFFMSGSQTGLNAYAPSCYPTLARGTGVSCMLGVGRLGSILGSSIGGILLSVGWGFDGIFPILAIPAVLAGISILVNRVAMHGHSN